MKQIRMTNIFKLFFSLLKLLNFKELYNFIFVKIDVSWFLCIKLLKCLENFSILIEYFYIGVLLRTGRLKN